VLGVRRNRPESARGWLTFAAGALMMAGGDVSYEVSGLVLGRHPYPNWDDAVYFAACPLLRVGLLLTRAERRLRAQLCFAPGLMETSKPGRRFSYAGTEEVPRRAA
jgi:hypothetical protein